jgi:hypothetical protein
MNAQASADQRLSDLGIVFPPPPAPFRAYGEIIPVPGHAISLICRHYGNEISPPDVFAPGAPGRELNLHQPWLTITCQ